MTLDLPEPPASGRLPEATLPPGPLGSAPAKSRVVAGYARFSPDDRSKITLEMQEERIRQTCQARGWTLWRTFRDDNLSGAVEPEQRPGLAELMDSFGNFDTVMSYEVARLAREPRLFWNLIHLFGSKGVAFLTAIMPDMDSTMPTFVATVGTMENMAAFDRLMTMEKTRDALAELKRRGFEVGRPPLGFVYLEKDGHKVRALDELGQKVRAIVEGNPKIKAVNVQRELGLDSYKTAWHLLNSVRDFLS